PLSPAGYGRRRMLLQPLPEARQPSVGVVRSGVPSRLTFGDLLKETRKKFVLGSASAVITTDRHEDTPPRHHRMDRTVPGSLSACSARLRCALRRFRRQYPDAPGSRCSSCRIASASRRRRVAAAAGPELSASNAPARRRTALPHEYWPPAAGRAPPVSAGDHEGPHYAGTR